MMVLVPANDEVRSARLQIRGLSTSRQLVKRGYAGPVPADCLRHDDYRSADFIGPMVAA